MTLSISDYEAKIAAYATKVTTLFEPKIEGAKEPVPEIWFDGVDPGATNKALVGWSDTHVGFRGRGEVRARALDVGF